MSSSPGGSFSRNAALLFRELTTAKSDDLRGSPRGIELLACRLLQEENLSAGILSRHALVVGPVLDRLGDVDLELVDLHLGQGRELECDGDLGSNGKTLPRDDDVVVKLVLPLAADGDGLGHLERHLIGQSDNGNLLDAVEIGLESTGAVDGSVELPLDRGILQLGGLELAVVDGKLKGIVVDARVEDLESLGLGGSHDSSLAFAEAA